LRGETLFARRDYLPARLSDNPTLAQRLCGFVTGRPCGGTAPPGLSGLGDLSGKTCLELDQRIRMVIPYRFGSQPHTLSPAVVRPRSRAPMTAIGRRPGGEFFPQGGQIQTVWLPSNGPAWYAARLILKPGLWTLATAPRDRRLMGWGVPRTTTGPRVNHRRRLLAGARPRAVGAALKRTNGIPGGGRFNGVQPHPLPHPPKSGA